MTESKTALLGESSGGVWSFLRWLVGGLAVLGGIVLMLVLAVHVVVDAEFLERRLNTALDDATDGRYRAKIEAVQWGLLVHSLRIEGVTLRPHSQSFEASRRSFPRRIRASVTEFRLDGLHSWTLIWNRRLVLDEVTVHQPRVRVQRGAEAATNDPSSADSSSEDRGTLAALRVHRFRVEDGTLTRERETGSPTDSLWGLSLRFDSLSTDSASGESPRHYLADRFVEGAFGGYRRMMKQKAYVLQLGPGRLSRPDSLLKVRAAHFAPPVSDEAFMQRYQYRVNRFRTRIKRVEAMGVDYARFMEEGALHAATIRIDTLHLDVYRDNHRPEDPHDPLPPMPQEAVEALGRRSLRIDTLRLQDSHIHYTKRPEGVPRTGSVWFDDLWATVYNVTNDPERMTAATPAVIEASTRVNGGGRLHTTLRVPLLAPHLTLSFRGGLGATDPRGLNETLVPLGGVHIESGHVDSLWFQADVENGVARGSVGGIYQHLEVELLDEATGDRGLGNRLKTVAAGLALRSSNLPEEGDLETGQIQHAHDPNNSFFKFLWHSLRDGIYSLVGIDRLPR